MKSKYRQLMCLSRSPIPLAEFLGRARSAYVAYEEAQKEVGRAYKDQEQQHEKAYKQAEQQADSASVSR